MIIGLLYLRLQRKRAIILKEHIEEAREAAEVANIVKREFLSNVSHELRTPLNSLLSITFLAEDTELSAFDAEMLEKLKSATNKLKTIIDTILDFSSLQNGELELVEATFELDKLLANLVDECAPKASEKGLQITFNADPNTPRKLIGDNERLRQVLGHLTENAIKFSGDGQIEVSIVVVEQQNDKATLKFAVSDTGIGMTEEDIDKIFQPFTQLDGSTTRKYGGLGMGLILSKQIIEMMGGRFHVDSLPGVGSTFSFEIELNVPEDAAEHKFSPELAHGNPEEVLAPQADEDEISLDLEKLADDFQELANRLQTNDSLALSILNGLRKKIPTSKIQPRLKELERLITLYEFDEALKSLSALGNEIGIPPESIINTPKSEDHLASES